MTISSSDLSWLEQQLHCRVEEDRGYQKYHVNVTLGSFKDYSLSGDYSMTEPVRRDPVLDVKICASDLSWLISTLKDVQKHEDLRKRYPGVDQAWKDYYMTAMLSAHWDDGKMY